MNLKTFQFRPYQWVEEDNPKTGYTRIYSWGLDRNSKPCLVYFDGFPTCCYLELPLLVNGRPYQWSVSTAQMIYLRLKEALHEDAPTSFQLVYKPKMYYYQPGARYPFIFLTFATKNALNHCYRLLTQRSASNKRNENGEFDSKRYPKFFYVRSIGKVLIKTWEHDFTCIRKLMTNRDFHYCQWLEIPVYNPNVKISTLEQEYIADWRTIKGIDPKITEGWFTYPRILSWDIECYSNRHNVMPNKYASKHVAYMISIVYQQLDHPETRQQIMIILGDCNQIKDTQVLKVKTEVELCHVFSQTIAKLDPEILIGYNIYGFDWPYLDARLKRRLQEWSQCSSRLKTHPPKYYFKEWSSSGYGYNSINYLNMSGRINIDLFPVVKRKFKYPKYTLNEVGKRLIGEIKHDVSPKRMFEIYEQFHSAKNNLITYSNSNGQAGNIYKNEYDKAVKQMTVVAEYAIQDSVLPLKIFEKINLWMELVALSNVVDVSPLDLITRGQQMRGVSLIYHRAVKSGYVVDTLLNPQVYDNWTGATVIEPLIGMHDNVICGDFSSLYPSIMMANNICFTTMVPPELYKVIPIDQCNVADSTTNEGEKFHVRYIKKEIKEGILAQLVRYLVTERKKVKIQMKDVGKILFPLKDVLKMIESNDNTSKLYNDIVDRVIRSNRKVIKFINDNHNNANNKQIINFIIEQVKELNLKYLLADCYQLALKVTANSMYGMMGIKNGAKFPMVEGAMAVTYFGRTYIDICQSYIRKTWNGIIVYGDTDSIMCTIPRVKSSKQCVKFGYILCKELSDIFPEDLVLEFEKSGRMLSLGKKKYIFWQHDKNGVLREDSDGMLMKGNILARRDNCQWQRNTYHTDLNKIMHLHPMQECLDIIVEEVVKMSRNQIPWGDLVTIRGISGSYKQDNYFMKIFGDELRRLGKIINPGDRLDYVVVKPDLYHLNGGDVTKLGYKMRSPEIFDERLNGDHPESIDTDYYISHVLQNCVEQLFYIGYKKQIDEVIAQNDYNDYMNIINDLSREEENIKLMFDFLQQQVKVDFNKHLSKEEQTIQDNRQRIKGLIDSLHRDYQKEIQTYLWIKTGAPKSFARIPYNDLYNLMDRLIKTTLKNAHENSPQKFYVDIPHKKLKDLFNRLKLDNYRVSYSDFNKSELMHHLRQTDEILLTYVWQTTGGSIDKTIDILASNKYKNWFHNSYKRYLGRGVVYYRLNDTPIGTLYKAIGLNQLSTAVKLLASPKCYQQLYPELIEN